MDPWYYSTVQYSTVPVVFEYLRHHTVHTCTIVLGDELTVILLLYCTVDFSTVYYCTGTLIHIKILSTVVLFT